jgi:hypothetical protein
VQCFAERGVVKGGYTDARRLGRVADREEAPCALTLCMGGGGGRLAMREA